MKTETFGPYEFVIVDAHIRLNRSRTLRDYSYIFANLGIALSATIFLFGVFFFIMPRPNPSFIVWIFIALFSFVVFISIKRLYTLFSIPLRDLIHVNKKEGIVYIRYAAGETYQLPLDKLLRLEYGFIDDPIQPLWESSYINRNVCGMVYTRTKDKKRVPFLLIKEPYFKPWNKSENLDLAKPLTERLGELLDIPAKFHRHISIDHYTGKES